MNAAREGVSQRTALVGLMMSIAAAGVVLGVGGCAGLSKQDTSTVIGAGVGGVAGSVLTDGGLLGTVGGAVVGGVIGNEVGKPKKPDH